ncbi:MAG: fibronectin type III domain-containing protein [Bacteroidetes bacterium]|nr:fibronectin type III domain-containing protein [Bacteroidota bacterium]
MRQYLRFKKYFIFSFTLQVVVLLFSQHFSFAQTYPVSATLQLTPPYSVYLSDYTVNDQMKLHLLLRDLSEPSYQIRLSLVLEGVGIRIESNPNMVPPPITIEGGIPSILSAEDLSPYLDTRNLIFSGISRQEYEQRAALPEGFYRFCFRVYDYKRKDVLLSQEACAQAWFMLNDPPRINTPQCGITLPLRDPQNILFQWLPMNANSPNSAFTTEYEFTLVEIRPPGRNPNDAMNVGYPLFQTTTQQTSLIYGLLEPPLIPGQEYAFRIRAIDTEGRDQFKNKGYSEVCTFKFGDTNGVPPLEGMNVYVEGERRAKVTWHTSLETDRYRVEYRKKSSGTAYTWFTIETTQDNALIQDLEPDTEYEVRVAGILRNQIGSYSPTKNFRTTPPRVFARGQEVANITPSNIKPLNTSMVGQIWKIGHFEMTVMEVSGGDGTYSGLGSVVVDYMGIKFFCRFDNIKVNEKQEIITGEVIVLREDAEVFKKRLIENNEKKKKDKAKGTSFEGIDIKFDGTIDSLYVNDAGEVIAVVASDEGVSGGSSKKEERKVDVKKGADNRITDDSGNVYVVGKDGVIEKMGSTGAGGTPAVAANVNYRVEFEKSSNQAYGFDQQQYSEHERNYEKYERDGKVYTIPWKSVASGRADMVIAKSTENRKDFSKEVIYKTDNGLLLRKPGNQENEVQLTVEGFGDQSTEQVTAYYKRKEADGKEKEVMAGKLNVVSYDKLVERLVIVSVNNTALNISTTELAESLNTIFAPAAVTWTVESQLITGINYDSNGKSGLDDGSTGLFSNYTAEMRTVINAYNDKYDIAKNTWYLFLVPNSESGRTQGFMPRKKQAGFIFMEQLGEASLAKVIGHEIGHGAFRLEHTFNTYTTLEKSSTDNLMDYQPNGITLHKYQWDLIHDPAAVLGLFEEDEGGAMYYDNTRMLTFLKTIRENNGKFARISDPGKDAYLTFKDKVMTEKDLKDQKIIDFMSTLSIYKFREPKDEIITSFISLINRNKGDVWSKLIEARTTPQPHDESPILLARMMNVEVDTKEKFTLSMNGYSLSEKSITLYAKESVEGNDVKLTFFNALSATPGVINPEPKTSTINIRKAFDITVHSNNANAFKEYIKLRGAINMIDENPESEEIIIDVVRKRSNQFITIDELSIRGTNIRGAALELGKGTDAESKATCTNRKSDCFECKRILPGEFSFEVTSSGGQGQHVYKTIRLLNTNVNGSQRDGILIHMGDALLWTQGCLLAMYDNEIEEIIGNDNNIYPLWMGYLDRIDERNAGRVFILSMIEFIEDKEKRLGKSLVKKVVITDDTNEQALTVSTSDFEQMQKANRYYYSEKLYEKAVEQFVLFVTNLQEKAIQDKLQSKLNDYTEKLLKTLTKENYKASEVRQLYEIKWAELYSSYADEITVRTMQNEVSGKLNEFQAALKANFEIFVEKDILQTLFSKRMTTLLHKNVVKSPNLKDDREVFKNFASKNLTPSLFANALANLKSKMIETEISKILKAIEK